MLARVYITPLATELGDLQDEIEITGRLRQGMRFSQRTEKNKWTHGLLAQGLARLKILNDDQMFSPSASGQSVFGLAGIDNARVRITYPTAPTTRDEITIWRGLLVSKDSKYDVATNECDYVARSTEAVLRDTELAPGVIQRNNTIKDVFQAIFNISRVNNVLPVYTDRVQDPVEFFTRIRSENDFFSEDRSVVKSLQKTLSILDGMISYQPSNNQIHLFTRGGVPVNGVTETPVRDFLELLDVDDGTEQVFNRVEVETGLAGANAITAVQNEGSQNRWGLRTLRVDGKWNRSLDECNTLAEYLVSRLSYPRRRLKIRLGGWDIPVERAIVGSRINLDVSAKASANSSRYGSTTFGSARYTQPRLERQQGVYYIEELERNLDGDTLDITIRSV